jgi:hypothetical protein
LAHGKRRPSVAMAHALIEGLELDPITAQGLLARAVPGVGRSSPRRSVNTSPAMPSEHP